ncbi:MAG: hypothetical protein ILP16_03125, partial [Spirochaetales bacterium]|nr:hypothetical protein [Spirochaetales bacterium]
MMKTENTNTIFAKVLAICMVVYAYIVTYIDGHLYAIPNVHTYVLVPVVAYAAFCFLYYLRDGLRITTSSVVFMVYGIYVVLRYVLAGIQDLMAIWGCMVI